MVDLRTVEFAERLTTAPEDILFYYYFLLKKWVVRLIFVRTGFHPRV